MIWFGCLRKRWRSCSKHSGDQFACCMRLLHVCQKATQMYQTTSWWHFFVSIIITAVSFFYCVKFQWRMLASAAINLRSSASRAFSKALLNSTAAPLRTLSPFVSRFSVRSMADSAAAPFKKIQIHRGDTVSLASTPFSLLLFFSFCFSKFWYWVSFFFQ